VAAGITTILPVFLRNPGEAEIAQLNRAIESVLSQEFGAQHELLIVDDGSDPLPVFPKTRVVRLLRNYGISYALNAGLTQASYDLIARIDADDAWRPGKLKKQLERLQADPELTLVASGMRLVHPHRPELDRDELRGGDWQQVLALAQRIGCPFPHGSILARRDVFEQLGGYPQAAALQHAEDYALWCQWMRFFKVAICEEIFLDYTISDRQISNRFSEEQQQASALAASSLDIRIPESLRHISAALGLTLLETSRRIFTAWRHYEHIVADPAIFEAAATLLPDRAVHRATAGQALPPDVFILSAAAQ
jgi:hypothetical protein